VATAAFSGRSGTKAPPAGKAGGAAEGSGTHKTFPEPLLLH